MVAFKENGILGNRINRIFRLRLLTNGLITAPFYQKLMRKSQALAASPGAQPNENDDLAQEAKEQVDFILANTQWEEYWSTVTEQSEPEIKAYEVACARSLASASRKFVH